MPDMQIDVLYSCAECGVRDALVKVRARQSDEDVVRWMQQVCTPALVLSHEERSPGCKPETLSEVKIPVTGAEWIGGPARH